MMIPGYEEGVKALNGGDYRRAVELLERAAAGAGFVSDIVNHAYTLALFRANEKDRLADIAFRVGSQLVDVDPASAIDYFQRAVQAGLDPVRLRQIGEIHERWAGAPPAGKIQGEVNRLGHVVTSLISGFSQTTSIRMLARSLKT